MNHEESREDARRDLFHNHTLTMGRRNMPSFRIDRLVRYVLTYQLQSLSRLDLAVTCAFVLYTDVSFLVRGGK